jgi:asparagine synthase (glutamine-hydrolysing)
MSGIAGIYNIDGAPVDRALLRRMTDAIAHRGPDGIHHWVDGFVGMGHCMLQTTPESVYEQQPLTDESGNLCLTMDGRVDNREELISALKSKGARLRDDTDAELVLKAYEGWGEDCPVRILGDFAFVIWDKRERRLFCARDILGIKPFCYYTDGERFLFASEPAQLLTNPFIPFEPNEGMIGEYLACAITSTEETLYAGLLRLPAAHSMVITPSRISKRRYWDIDAVRELHHRNDEEYAEHFRVVLSDSVRCRLRSQKPVGVELSGGLDSSSIVCTVRALLRERHISAPGLETLSLVFPGLPFDESSYIDEVSRSTEIVNNSISGLRSETLDDDGLTACHSFPLYPNQEMYRPLLLLARQKRMRVVMTGLGGDDWLTGNPQHCADLLRRLKFSECVRELRYRSDDGITFSSFLAYAVRPLLPQSLRIAGRVLRRLVRRGAVAGWVSPRFAARIKLHDRITRSRPELRQPATYAQENMYRWLTGGWLAHHLEVVEAHLSRFGLVYHCPFHDKRVVEFGFALPEEQRWRGEHWKFILRNCMKGTLPDKVRLRTQKVAYDQVFAKALAQSWNGRSFHLPNTLSLGWLKSRELGAMYKELEFAYRVRNQEWLPHVWPLWTSYAIDKWFGNEFSSKHSGEKSQSHALDVGHVSST